MLTHQGFNRKLVKVEIPVHRKLDGS